MALTAMICGSFARSIASRSKASGKEIAKNIGVESRRAWQSFGRKHIYKSQHHQNDEKVC